MVLSPKLVALLAPLVPALGVGVAALVGLGGLRMARKVDLHVELSGCLRMPIIWGIGQEIVADELAVVRARNDGPRPVVITEAKIEFSGSSLEVAFTPGSNESLFKFLRPTETGEAQIAMAPSRADGIDWSVKARAAVRTPGRRRLFRSAWVVVAPKS